MQRIAIVAAVTLALVAPNIIAQTNNPQDKPAATSTTKDGATTSPAAPDQGIRKLSRRERKERRKNLSDKYQQFLLDVDPIMQPEELDSFLILESDAQRDLYIDDFWHRRDVAQGTTNHTFRDEYYARLDEVKTRFRYVSTDRSRMFLIHGEPNDVVKPDCGELLQPIEIWKYAYIPGLGHDRSFIFYVPRRESDYKLWIPIMDQSTALAELVSESQEARSATQTAEGQVDRIFLTPVQAGTNITLIQEQCSNADELMRAVFQDLQDKVALVRVYNPPPANEENVRRILSAVVLANPNAPPLPAEMKATFPAKQGGRTDVELTILVPRAGATLKDVGGTKGYSFDITGEVIKDKKLFENFRYRFDFPGDVKDEKLPLVVDRLLRPNTYTARIRVTDIHSGAEKILEQTLDVPEIFDSPAAKQAKEAAATRLDTLKDAIESNQTSLRIVPFPDEILSGIQHIETIAVGGDIKAVAFYLDGKQVMIKRQPPYTLDLDFGEVPRARRIRAVALDAKGQILTGDDVVVNAGTDPFRVRIVSPRVAVHLRGLTRVQMSVRVPDGKTLDNVKLFYNETAVATLYGPPWVQTVDIPQSAGVAYLRAVATLKDDPTPPVEDVVMINTPQFMEEVNVHLVELPTTVILNGHPINTLSQSDFKVFDEGRPVKLARFEEVKNLPLSLGMAIDTSGSMQPRMEEAQKAGASFFKSVLRPGDKAFLVSFDTQPELVQKWSTRLADVNAGLSKLRAEESTSLYDAVVFSLYNFLGIKGQKALILITDGRDTSSKFSFDQALEYARRTAVPIYAIAIGMKTTDIDVRYKLGKFCAETGGNLYSIETADQLNGIYKEIQEELRSQYILGFYPSDQSGKSSEWHDVSVQVTRGKVKTIHGYYP